DSRFVLRQHIGVTKKFIAEFGSLPMDHPIVREAANSRISFAVSENGGSGSSWASVPLMCMDRPLGVMVLTARGGGWFDEEAKRLLGIVGAQVGSTIHNSMLYSQAQETRDYLEGLIQNTADAIVTYALDGTVRTWNEAAVKIYGYQEEEAIGQTFANIPDSQLQEMNQIMRRVASGETVNNHRTVLRTKDGGSIPADVTYSPVRNASGAVVAVSSISREAIPPERCEPAPEKPEQPASGMKLHEVVNVLIPLLMRRSLPDAERRRLVAMVSERMEGALYPDYLDANRPLEPKDLGEGISRMFNDLGGKFDAEARPDGVVITASKCPWENGHRRNPANCMLTKAIITRFAVRAWGDARVNVSQTLANRDDCCRVTVHRLERPSSDNERAKA
ncbi:MAG: PAS domain S-box protein, partial [Methanomassiliicoccales archaeon]|nr:PAS domain S-box protein [Methanomassiliicoccales archaeon]